MTQIKKGSPTSNSGYVSPFDDKTVVRPASRVDRAVAPAPEPTPASVNLQSVNVPRATHRRDSYDESLDPETSSSGFSDHVKRSERDRRIIGGIAIVAAVIICLMIVRKMSDTSSETPKANDEALANKRPAKATADGSVGPTADKMVGRNPGSGTMDQLMRQFDQAYFRTQSQIH